MAEQMTKEEIALKHQKICDGVGVAIATVLAIAAPFFD